MSSPQTGRRKLFLLLGLAAVAIVAAVWFTRDDGAPPALDDPQESRLQKPPPAAGGYVGSRACAECHPKIAASFAKHPMGRSARRVATAHDLKNAGDAKSSVFKPAAGLEYQIREDNGRVVHEEIIRGADGTELSRQTVQVHIALGSGQRGHSYLIDRGEALFVSPIAWYSQKSRWGLSPNYVPFKNERFERPATRACLRCHLGHMEFEPREQKAAVVKPVIQELAIGCENCHGPGKAHVAYRRSDQQTGLDPIVNPSKLSPPKRESVCNQCHLSGREIVPRYGRKLEDFRPGMHLSDVLCVFTAGRSTADGENTKAVSHVEQMRSSRCFQKSADRLGCISCHDPHSKPAANERPAFFNARCAKCHIEAQSGCAESLAKRRKPEIGNSCIRCHMPRFDAGDVPHTTQTDHRILRRPNQHGGDAKSPTGQSPGALILFDGDRLSETARNRATHIAMARFAEVAQDQKSARRAGIALRQVLKQAPDDSLTLDALARCHAVLGQVDSAVDYWKRALQAAPNDQAILYSLTLFLYDTGKFRAALPNMIRFNRANPWLAGMQIRQSLVEARIGRLDAALLSARRGVKLNPANPRYHIWLAELLRRKKPDDPAARRHDEIARGLRDRLPAPDR